MEQNELTVSKSYDDDSDGDDDMRMRSHMYLDSTSMVRPYP